MNIVNVGYDSTNAIRLAEVMAALSLATDLGMGQPLEFALTGCVLATRMGESLGMPPSDLRDVYYFGLLRFIGCNSDTYAIAALWMGLALLASLFLLQVRLDWGKKSAPVDDSASGPGASRNAPQEALDPGQPGGLARSDPGSERGRHKCPRLTPAA